MGRILAVKKVTLLSNGKLREDKIEFFANLSFLICYYGVVMRLLSLDELAERWTLAHTIAVAAWAVVLVLGAMLYARNHVSTYPATDNVKVYAAENATFKYPENWQINDCASNKPFIELPGSIRSNYKDQKAYQLQIYGTGALNCINDRPERLDIYSENIVASDNPCAPATSTQGEQLTNGLYLQLAEQDGEVVAVRIKQNSCFAPAHTALLGFAFIDPNGNEEDTYNFGPPRVPKEVFLASRQYRDIRALAESIKY